MNVVHLVATALLAALVLVSFDGNDRLRKDFEGLLDVLDSVEHSTGVGGDRHLKPKPL